MTRTVLSVCAAALLSTACAPLAQAPLVYSSKIQGGFGIVTTVADSPGVDINIGYKSSDTAYVPVAVSQPCPITTGCSADRQITIISAGDINNTGGPVTDEQLAAAKRALADAVKAQDRSQTTLDAAKARLENSGAAATLQAQEAKLATLRTMPPNADNTPAKTAEGESLADLEAKATAARKALEDLQAPVTTAQAELEKASDARRNADILVATLESALDRRGGSNRADAYSVFGSFNNTSSGNGGRPQGSGAVGGGGGGSGGGGGDGGAGGGAGGNSQPSTGGATPSVAASMTLGKVFSTGMASQNLTAGLRGAATITATTQCLQAAAVLLNGVTDEAKKDALREAALEACSAPQRH